MKRFLWLLLVITQASYAQRDDKASKKTIKHLKKHIGYLASDKLEGRRTGSKGEKLAYEYIRKQYSKAGLQPKGENGDWLQEFEVNDGLSIDPKSLVNIDGKILEANKDWFPLYTTDAADWQSGAMIKLDGTAYVLLWDIKGLIDENANNPHFDLPNAIKTKADEIGAMSMR